jgi:hypothetical protein
LRAEKKTEARKILVSRDESHLSGARFVRQPLRLPKRWQKKDTAAKTTNFYTQLWFWQHQKIDLPEQ